MVIVPGSSPEEWLFFQDRWIDMFTECSVTLPFSENSTCFQNKRLARHEKTKWQNISGWKIFSFSQKSRFPLTWVKPLFIIYVTTSWPHWPLLILSSLVLFFTLHSPIPSFLCCTLPQHIYLVTPCCLLSSFHSWPSLHHIPLSYLSRVMSLENVPLEEMTGNRRQRCLAGALPLRSQGMGNTPQRVLTPQGCAASDRMTRGGCVREEKGQEGMWSSNSGDGLEFF